MAKRVVLCADEESLRNPQLLGLEESNLQAVSWIECCATAEECRRAARRDGIEEAWVVSCDDMEPLNVAAALKYDDPCKKVYLACAVNNGSLASRASLAKVDGVLSQACFADRFVFAKSLWGERGQKVGHEEEGSSFDCGDGRGKEPGTQAANGTTVRAEADECESQTFLGLDESAQSRKERRRVSEEGAGTVVAVVGASGGCGKSRFCCSMAAIIAPSYLQTPCSGGFFFFRAWKPRDPMAPIPTKRRLIPWANRQNAPDRVVFFSPYGPFMEKSAFACRKSRNPRVETPPQWA